MLWNVWPPGWPWQHHSITRPHSLNSPLNLPASANNPLSVLSLGDSVPQLRKDGLGTEGSLPPIPFCSAMFSCCGWLGDWEGIHNWSPSVCSAISRHLSPRASLALTQPTLSCGTIENNCDGWYCYQLAAKLVIIYCDCKQLKNTLHHQHS